MAEVWMATLLALTLWAGSCSGRDASVGVEVGESVGEGAAEDAAEGVGEGVGVGVAESMGVGGGLGARRVLLQDVQEALTRTRLLEYALRRALVTPPTSYPVPPLLSVAISPAADVDALAVLKDALPPVVVLSKINGRPVHTIKSKRLPRPMRGALLLLGDGAPRREVRQLLALLRAFNLWAAGAPVVVVLGAEGDAAATERALARGGALRAVGIATSPAALALAHAHAHARAHAHALLFDAERRPPRPPLRVPVPDGALSIARPELRDVPVVFSTLLARNKTMPWGDFERVLVHYIKSVWGVRTLCTSRGWTPPSRYYNGSYSAIADAVLRGRADVLLYKVIGLHHWHDNFDVFLPHNIEKVCVYVRTPKTVPFVMCLLTTLSEDVKIVTLVSLVALAVTRWFAGENGGVIRAIVDSMSFFITGMYKVQGSYVLRLLRAGTAFFGTVMVAALLSQATSCLSVPSHTKYPSTLREVNEQMTALYGDVETGKLFDTGGELLTAMRRKYTGSDNFSFIMAWAKETLQTGTSALVLQDSIVPYTLWRRELLQKRYSQFQRVQECVSTASHLSFLARKNWPYTRTFRVLVQRAVEAGLSKQSDERQLYRRRYRSRQLPRKAGKGTRSPSPLRCEDLLRTFAMWGGGLALSATVWAAEVAFEAGRSWTLARRAPKASPPCRLQHPTFVRAWY